MPVASGSMQHAACATFGSRDACGHTRVLRFIQELRAEYAVRVRIGVVRRSDAGAARAIVQPAATMPHDLVRGRRGGWLDTELTPRGNA
jgi:hypothetical protein